MAVVQINELFSQVGDILNEEGRATEETFDAITFLSKEVKRSVGGAQTVERPIARICGFFMCVYDTLMDNATMSDAAFKAINVLSNALAKSVRRIDTGYVVTYVDGSSVHLGRPAKVGHA